MADATEGTRPDAPETTLQDREMVPRQAAGSIDLTSLSYIPQPIIMSLQSFVRFDGEEHRLYGR